MTGDMKCEIIIFSRLPIAILKVFQHNFLEMWQIVAKIWSLSLSKHAKLPKCFTYFQATWLDGLSRVQLLCYVASPQFLLSGKSSKVKVSRVVLRCYDVLMELLRSKQVHHILDGTLIGLPKLEKHLQWMFEEVKKLVGYEICECLNVRNL